MRKGKSNLAAELDWASARTYILSHPYLRKRHQQLVTVEIPTRPFADLLFDFLGLTEGPFLLAEDHEEIGEILRILESKQQRM